MNQPNTRAQVGRPGAAHFAASHMPGFLNGGVRGETMATEWIPRNEYGKKLQDPRWQKKRLEVMERDRFQCQSCGDCRSMLNVHHVMYCPWERVDPWDEPEGLLVTLCAACHEYEPTFYRQTTYMLIRMLGDVGIRTALDMQWLAETADQDVFGNENFSHLPKAQNTARALALWITRFEEWKEESIASEHNVWFGDAPEDDD